MMQGLLASLFGATIEVWLFVAAVGLTAVTATIFVVAVLRHAHRDGDGSVPSDSDDQGCA